jgi:hypothetical protein
MQAYQQQNACILYPRVRLHLFFRVIAAADHRAAFDVPQAAGFTFDLPGGKFMGMNPPRHRQVFWGR